LPGALWGMQAFFFIVHLGNIFKFPPGWDSKAENGWFSFSVTTLAVELVALSFFCHIASALM